MGINFRKSAKIFFRDHSILQIKGSFAKFVKFSDVKIMQTLNKETMKQTKDDPFPKESLFAQPHG